MCDFLATSMSDVEAAQAIQHARVTINFDRAEREHPRTHPGIFAVA